MPPESVTLAQRYVLEAPIASGGMGEVWRAKDDVLARTVAVKVLHAHLSEDDEFLARFRHEALAAARLSHPSIVAIYDTGSDAAEPGGPERHFIVMEYCSGGTLEDALVRGGPMDAERAVHVGIAICDALGYAHRSGVVHRDVKPANVLVAADGTLKVADFGIAKAAFSTGDITTTGSIIGTVTYLSPEQARGEEPDARSDLYALGVVLYELVTGRPPFSGESQLATAMMHLHDEPPAPRGIKAGVPRGLETVILRALRKDPGERYSSAEEMAGALSGALSGNTTLLRPPRREEPRRPTAPEAAVASGADARWIVPVVLVVVVVVALALALPRLLGDDDTAPERDAPGAPQEDGIAALDVEAVEDFDPYGDQEEHSEDARYAADGRPDTTWETESYTSSMESQGKAGVGLVLDLGASRTVERVELSGSSGALELRYADEAGDDETAFSVAGELRALAGRERVELDDPVEARYWLVWITSVSETGTGQASVAEVELLGS
ncbi:MAG TPA: protein kinase [Actinomycetota bacterium]|nr:protein kinase [Actinomycetota bacterium]